MKKLNILNIGPTPPRKGGSAFVNIETMRGLAERGHYVRCITFMPGEYLREENYDESWRDTSIEVYPIEAPFVQSSRPLSPEEMERRENLILEKFHALVDNEKPDVVMVGHESYSYYANEEARKIGIPLVQVLHGTPTHLIDDGVLPPEMTERFLDSINQATLVVGVSNYLSGIVKRHGIKQATYIHNGTDTEKFRPKEKDPEFLSSLGIDVGNRVIMHASTLRPIKRPLDIVRSAPLVLEKYPETVFVIVGEGVLKEKMKEEARKSGVYDSFRFVGSVDYDEMPEYFSHADMFLLPSEREGFGRVIREAQACSAVPIASDIKPMDEVIEDRKTGYLFERGNAEKLARSILELSQDEEKRMYIGKRGRDVAVDNNLANMITRYEMALFDPVQYLESVA